MKVVFSIGLLGGLLAPLFMATATTAAAEALEGRSTPGEALAATAPADWRVLDQEDLLYIELERGTVVVAFATKLAQNHVKRVKKLARDEFYDGKSFYRVIDGFVAQGGDPFEQAKSKKPYKPIKAEFTDKKTDAARLDLLTSVDGYATKVGFVDSLPAGVNEAGDEIWHLHCTGSFAFGRENDKDSASTEFYISLQPQRYLDRNISVFGRVVYGMEHVQALRRVAVPQSEDDDLGESILSMRVGSDLAEAEQINLEILKSGTEAFDDYVEARRNRAEAFFYYRPNNIGVCDLSVPVRKVAEGEDG